MEEIAVVGLDGRFPGADDIDQFWSMLRDLRRFYNQAPGRAAAMSADITLGEFLDTHGYGAAFQQDHLLPMAAAIWSASAESLRGYPALHFIRFCDNHGLLKFTDRPIWRTYRL